MWPNSSSFSSKDPASQPKKWTFLFALRELNYFPLSEAFMRQSVTFIAETESVLMLSLMNWGAFAFPRSCPLFPFIPNSCLSLWRAARLCFLYMLLSDPKVWWNSRVSQTPHYVLPRNSGLINGESVTHWVWRKIQDFARLQKKKRTKNQSKYMKFLS